MKYRIRVYNHETKAFIANTVVEANSITIAAKFAEKVFESLQTKNKDVTLKIDELKDSVRK